MSTVLTKSFDKTKTVNARWSRIDFTPTGGSAVKISCKLLDPESKLTTQILKQPGSDDLNRDVDEVATESEETFALVDIEEIDLVLATLGGLNGLKKGAAVVYVKDPRDATGKVKYSVTLSACSLRRNDGAVRMGGDWSKTTLLLRSLTGAPLAWVIAPNAPDTVE